MAFPKDLTRVHTNLGMLEFQEIVEALRTPSQPEIHWLGPHMEFAGYLEAKFMFRGKTYRLNEEFELVVSILAD